MTEIAVNTRQLVQMFPDAEAGRLYLEGRLWPRGAICPTCKDGSRATSRKGGYYRCNACKQDFTVRTGTIFERSHVPLHKWIYAMYLLETVPEGISSIELAREIGITQKSAWSVLQRLRRARGDDRTLAEVMTEADGTRRDFQAGLARPQTGRSETHPQLMLQGQS